MQGERKTQTQIKLGGVSRSGGGGGGGGGASRSAAVSYSGSGGGGGSSSKNTFELKNLFSAGKGGGEPIVDDMKYRKPSRLIALVDIGYSSFLLVAQLLNLITGAAHESTKLDESDGESSVDNNDLEDAGVVEEATMSLTQKQRETIAVLVWIGMFTVLILQLVVAGALYGGTFERDGRKCMRNCKIWLCTTVFLVVVLVLQILAIFIFGNWLFHLLLLGLLLGEVTFRTVGLVFITKFFKELSFEFDDNDSSSCGGGGSRGCSGGGGGGGGSGSISPRDLNRIAYEPLCSSPSLQSSKVIVMANAVHNV